MEAIPANAPLVIHRKVKWGDCDPAGIVYTPRFADFVVEAHVEFVDYLFGSSTHERLRSMQLSLPAKAIEIEFRQSLWPGQAFDMTMYVAAIRTRTYDLRVTGSLADASVAFVGTLTLICMNLTTRTGAELPQFVREKLLANQHGAVAPGQPSHSPQ